MHGSMEGRKGNTYLVSMYVLRIGNHQSIIIATFCRPTARRYQMIGFQHVPFVVVINQQVPTFFLNKSLKLSTSKTEYF
jgi:hypothetical protein